MANKMMTDAEINKAVSGMSATRVREWMFNACGKCLISDDQFLRYLRGTGNLGNKYDQVHRKIIRHKTDWIFEKRARLFEMNALSRCESPIEKILASYLLILEERLTEEVSFPVTEISTPFDCQVAADRIAKNSEYGEAIWAVFPQVFIGDYRVDFLLHYVNRRDKCASAIVIECDGHDYHERSKEQATRDKRRDREIKKQGFETLRFTGSEIYSRPFFVVDEIRRAAKETAGEDPGHNTTIEWCEGELMPEGQGCG